MEGEIVVFDVNAFSTFSNKDIITTRLEEASSTQNFCLLSMVITILLYVRLVYLVIKFYKRFKLTR